MVLKTTKVHQSGVKRGENPCFLVAINIISIKRAGFSFPQSFAKNWAKNFTFAAAFLASVAFVFILKKNGTSWYTKSNDVKRFLYDGTFTVGFDSQGRILIPASLREYSMLGEEAHIIGMASNLEIWNTELWAAENSKYTPEAIASIVE